MASNSLVMRKGTRNARTMRRSHNVEDFSLRLVPTSKSILARRLPEYKNNPAVIRTVRWTVVGTGTAQSPSFLTFTNIDTGDYGSSTARYTNVRLLAVKVYFQVSGDSASGSNLCTVSYDEPNNGGTIVSMLFAEAYPVTGLNVVCIHIKPSMTMMATTWAALNPTAFLHINAPTNIQITVDATLSYT